MSPVYWKPKYATRNKLHRSFVARQAAREAEVRRGSGSLRGWLRRLFRRAG